MDDISEQLKEVANQAFKSKSVKESAALIAKAYSLFLKKNHELRKINQELTLELTQEKAQLKNTEAAYDQKVETLKHTTSYLNKILKNIRQGIIFINTEGVITTFNNEAEKILEKSCLEDKVYWNHFSDDFFGFSVSDSLKYGLSYNINFLYLNHIKEIEVATKFVYSEEKQQQGLVLLLRDITEVEKLKKQKNRHDRLNELGKMAATVAHEIKNPLGAIRGYASLLSKDLEDSGKLKEKADYILEATRSLERVVNSILHYSRPLQVEKSTYDLCKIIKELVRSIKIDTSFSTDVEIVVHLPIKSLEVLIDQDLIRLCLLNILANAYQAIEDKGQVEICLLQRNDGCVLSISDTGKGMSEKQMEHIFSPFFTTKQEGNGLGLSEAFRIIQEHKGTIDVSSKVGVGSTFNIYLPLKEKNNEN